MRNCPTLICSLLAALSLPAFAGKAVIRGASGGTDQEQGESEGWIIKKTKNGYVKIPKKQKFKFGESSIEGDINRPAESVLSPRNSPRETSLIEERKSFRKEILGSVGLAERKKP